VSWEAVTALGALASAIVVAVAATAAVLQIRHLRAGNQLEAILRIYDTFNSTEMVEARRYCIYELPGILADNASRAALLGAAQLDRRISLVGNFNNEIGTLVVAGFLDERLIWPLIPLAARIWRTVAPIAHEWRRKRNDPIWFDFEYIAALEERVTPDTHISRFPAWFRARLQSEKEP
jgi:hypothetical protein